MSRDDIIQMAVEAGLLRTGEGWTEPHRWGLTEIEKFAALVIAAERNRTWTQDHWTEYERSIAAAEREACAQVCEARFMGDLNREDQEARRCAEAIRARGEA